VLLVNLVRQHTDKIMSHEAPHSCAVVTSH
jgi:hypothetical protein